MLPPVQVVRGGDVVPRVLLRLPREHARTSWDWRLIEEGGLYARMARQQQIERGLRALEVA